MSQPKLEAKDLAEAFEQYEMAVKASTMVRSYPDIYGPEIIKAIDDVKESAWRTWTRWLNDVLDRNDEKLYL